MVSVPSRVPSNALRFWLRPFPAAAIAATALLPTLTAAATPGDPVAVPLIPQQQIVPYTHSPVGWFGTCVAVDGDVAMIGAPLAVVAPGVPCGVVVIYERDAAGMWTEAILLEPNKIDDVRRFGWSIDLEGDRALIGAMSTNVNGIPGAGAAFVYERTSAGVWAEAAAIPSPAPTLNEGFGQHVDLQGDMAMIGPMYGAGNGLDDAGFVRVFERSAAGTWNLVQTIVPEDVTQHEYFGRDFEIVGNRVLVGAALRDHGVNNQGGAYIFERDPGGTWTQAAVLAPPDGQPNGFVGEWVGFDGTRAILSKRFDDYPAFNAGAAYTYESPNGAGWSFAQKLHPCEASSEDGFSLQLDYDGSLLALASTADSPAGPNQGVIRLFALDADGAWLEVGGLYAIAEGDAPLLDRSLAIDGMTVVAASFSPAAAVFYDLTDAPLLETAPCPTLSGDFNGDGAVDASDLAVLLYAWGPCVGPVESWKDIDGDQLVGPLDLALLLAGWSG